MYFCRLIVVMARGGATVLPLDRRFFLAEVRLLSANFLMVGELPSFLARSLAISFLQLPAPIT
jgi:hypothetical protein